MSLSSTPEVAAERSVRVALPPRTLGPAMRRLWRRSPGLLVGVALMLAIVVLASLVRLFTVDPLLPAPSAILQPPSLSHLMGTDAFGRDVFARVVAAAQLDLLIAFSVAAIAFVVGSMVGALSGFLAGAFDLLMMRLVDIVQSFPAFILAIGLTAMLGNTVPNVVAAVAVAYTPYFIRLVRSEMIKARETEYARAAKCVGNPPLRVLTYHLLPNCLGPAIVQATLCLGWAILDAAGLSFLGLGIHPPTAEWGVLVAEGTQYVNSGQWWISVFPGVMIVCAVLGFNLIGDRLRQAMQH
jgi:peptide/nickel transport system permease protein